MAGELSLFVNTQTRSLAFSFLNSSGATLPTFVQFETVDLLVYFVTPAGINAASPFQYVDFSGGTLKVAICGGTGQPVGNAPNVEIAFQDTFSDIPNGFSGLLSLDTVAVGTFLGSETTKLSTFEVQVTPPASDPIKYLSIPVTIKAGIITGADAVPVPISSYMTRNEALAAFVKQIGLPGETVQFTSPNGSWGRILGVRDDGTRQDDVIAL